jgi:shikimate dehydrogenase
VIGDPVGHSRSPAILNAAFEATGIDWVFVGFPVRAGAAADAVNAMRTLGIIGMSVTMPHKVGVIDALDSLSGTASRLGAVNCIARDGEQLIGHNTDGDGLLASLRAEGVEPSGSRVVVLGAGGAARAAVLALGDAGAAEVVVANRSPERGAAAAGLVRNGRAVGLDEGPEALTALLAHADLLINATPVGMADGDATPVPREALHRGLVVSDLIYHPSRTPLMEAASEAGAQAHNGLGMLVGQAAAAFSIWTGLPAPIGAMASAAGGEPRREN